MSEVRGQRSEAPLPTGGCPLVAANGAGQAGQDGYRPSAEASSVLSPASQGQPTPMLKPRAKSTGQKQRHHFGTKKERSKGQENGEQASNG